MERFRPEDFEPGRRAPATGTTLPDVWPIAYRDLEPHYREAEELYRVRGTPDPLFPDADCVLDPPAATTREQSLIETLGECGLHPYRFHYACERVAGCDGCPATLCTRNCRNDAHTACFEPAVDRYGASLISRCRVHRLESSNRQVTEVVAGRDGQDVRIKARVVVLAAGAFGSPLILMRSASGGSDRGLANGSGMVGRNLMLHVSDTVMLKHPGVSGHDMSHGIGLNDFYVIDGVKHGNIHAHPTNGRRSFLRRMLRSNRTPFSTIVDDLPYLDNRVLAGDATGDSIACSYTVHDELRRRARTIIDRFSDAVRSRCSVTVPAPGCELNRGHACGTVRFGDDPKTSVLDATNRAHELDNLYVVDASCFPSSGGINPSLTIAANALRVADIISNRL